MIDEKTLLAMLKTIGRENILNALHQYGVLGFDDMQELERLLKKAGIRQ